MRLLGTVDQDEGPKPLTCPWEAAGGDWAPLAAQISELFAGGRWSTEGRFSWGVTFTDCPCICASAFTELLALPQLAWAVPSPCGVRVPCSPSLAQGFVDVLL